MDQLREKKLEAQYWPLPFVMDPKYFSFGLSDKLNDQLNKEVYKARLEYQKKCADAESEMLGKILGFLKRHKI
jgi:hypothetical protein